MIYNRLKIFLVLIAFLFKFQNSYNFIDNKKFNTLEHKHVYFLKSKKEERVLLSFNPKFKDYFDAEFYVLNLLKNDPHIIYFIALNLEGLGIFVEKGDIDLSDLKTFIRVKNNIVNGNLTYSYIYETNKLEKIKRVKNKIRIYRDTEIINLFINIAEGIKLLHQNNIIHTDIKPDNVVLFINKHGDLWPKLIDFEHSIHTQLPNGKYKIKGFHGALEYICPNYLLQLKEKGRNSKLEVSEKIDIYSFGILMFNFINNKDLTTIFEEEVDISPNKLDHSVAIMRANMLKNNEWKIHFTTKTYPQLEKLILSCVQFNPEDRPSIEEIINQLKEINDEIPEDKVSIDNEEIFLSEEFRLLFGDQYGNNEKSCVTIRNRLGCNIL